MVREIKEYSLKTPIPYSK